MWQFAFSSIFGWSVGDFIFKYFEREGKEYPFLDFIAVIIILTVVGGLMTDFVVREATGFWTGTTLYLGLSFLVCIVAFVDYQVKDWSQLHSLWQSIQQRLSRRKRN
jgi:hypothetical protein